MDGAVKASEHAYEVRGRLVPKVKSPFLDPYLLAEKQHFQMLPVSPQSG